MYSGFISTRHAISWLGAHQRFNKIAYRTLGPYLNAAQFPSIKNIIHFEGVNGPDGLKVKSAGQHEPKHFYNPVEDTGPIPEYISEHYQLLVKALKKGDMVKAAFEAAWLAHCIADGLTPAHHHPYDEEVGEMRANSGSEIKKHYHKIIIKGETKQETLKQTWKMMGAKGLFTTHFNFEMGVAGVLLSSRFQILLDTKLLQWTRKRGPVALFKVQARIIDRHSMYERFYKTGWTIGLARLVKKILIPTVVQTIAITWALAAEEAGIKPQEIVKRLS